MWLGLALAVVGLWDTASGAAESDGAARMACFVRPKNVPFPPETPFSPEKAEPGRMLFFDSMLSRSGTISCATCHHPRLAWGDGLPRAIGEARTPLFAHHAGSGLRDISQNEVYRAAFERVFPGEGVSHSSLERALATYERTIVPAIAPFDRWIAGDEAAIPEAAKRGFDLFTGRAECAECHAGWRFTDDSFREIGVAGENDWGRGRLFPKSARNSGHATSLRTTH